MALDQVLRGKMNDEARRAVVDHIGPAIESQMESVKRAVLDAVAVQTPSTTIQPKTNLPWVLTFAAMLFIVLLLVGSLWTRLLQIEDQHRIDLQYNQELAHWLVLSGRAHQRNAEAMDIMLRRVAKAVGVDVSDIHVPEYLEPPNSVQRYHLEFE